MTERFQVARHMKVEELISRYERITPDVDEKLKQASISERLPLPTAPKEFEDPENGIVEYGENGDPLIPKDLTDLTSVQLGKLFSFLTNWANYVMSEETRARCSLLVQKRHKQVIEAALSAYYKEEEKVPTHLLDAKVVTDTRYVDIDAAVLAAQVFTEKAGTRLEQHKRSLHLISREQSRRGEDLERTERAEGSPFPRSTAARTRFGPRPR